MPLTNDIQRRGGGDPLAAACDQNQQALQVCDMLEALADDLPNRKPGLWRQAQGRCRRVLWPYFIHLHDAVLPRLMRQTPEAGMTHQMLRQLQLDCSDRVHGLSDLDDLFSATLGNDRFADEPEALGYALRGHFDPLRRDLRWLRDVIWPLLPQLLSEQEVARLQAPPPKVFSIQTWPAT